MIRNTTFTIEGNLVRTAVVATSPKHCATLMSISVAAIRTRLDSSQNHGNVSGSDGTVALSISCVVTGSRIDLVVI